jgi:hypothetical protein
MGSGMTVLGGASTVVLSGFFNGTVRKAVILFGAMPRVVPALRSFYISECLIRLMENDMFTQALAQIQKPTWWVTEECSYREGLKMAASRRKAELKQDILDLLETGEVYTQLKLQNTLKVSETRMYYAMKELRSSKKVVVAGIIPYKGSKIMLFSVPKH